MNNANLVGEKFGRLTVVEFVKLPRRSKLKCECECGATVLVPPYSVKSGQTSSCGCLRVDVARERKTIHGGSKRSGCTPEYGVWKNMRERCGRPTNNRYSAYKGRGIDICDRWKNSFKNFLDDMGPRPSRKHSIDRIDNDGPYSPDNCRWATPVQQANNRRSCRIICLDGVCKTVTEWADQIGIPRGTLFSRLNRGNSIENSLSVALAGSIRSQKAAQRRKAA